MSKVNMSVTIAGVTLKNPIIAASGTIGFGREYADFFPLSALGGICVKGLTLEPRMGNPPPRVTETPMGMLNSIGLQNPGVEAFIKNDLPWLKSQDVVVIANAAGSTVSDYAAICERLSDSDVDMIELNISCPNVKEGGAAFGTSCASVETVVKAACKTCKKPLIVKLSPNVTDIAEIARSAEAAGADSLSLINTLLGMRIDIRTGQPILHNNMGGLSGRAVLPVAIRMVWQVRNAVSLPIIGLGGVASWQDAAEIMAAGADAVQVGTALFTKPNTPIAIIQGLEQFAEELGLPSVTALTGRIRPW